MSIAIVIAAVVVFEVAAVKFGSDSRDMDRNGRSL